MAVTLDDLISPDTQDQVLTFLLTQLAALGFPVTAWQTGGVIYTILRIEALSIADKVALIASIAKGGLLDLSTGDWLTLLATSQYNLARYTAQFAIGNVAVSIASGSGAQTLQPGQLWITTPLGQRYNSVNAAPVVIGAGPSSAVIPFRAESPGAAYNVALGTGLSLVTPLPGTTAAFVDTSSSGTWLTTQGADAESDDNLRLRCRTRWATVGLQKTSDAYTFLALDTPGLSTQPNRVYVDATNPRGPGTLNVWFAGPSGPLSGGDASLISAYILARKSECSDVQATNAVVAPVTLAATVFYRGGFTGALAQASSNLTTLINGLPIGGLLYLADVIEQIQLPDGVVDSSAWTINGSALDLQLAANQVATVAAINLTGVIVP